MRASVQKKRPRDTAGQTGSARDAESVPVGTGRPTHVRNRLIVAVAVVAAAVAAAGAPSVLAASAQLSDSQDLVTLAGRTQNALALAHSLADERDEVTAYVAAGRPKSEAPSAQRGARVDRQVQDLRADSDTPGRLREDLDDIAALRRSALTGKSTALETHQAYSTAITELHRLAEDLADQMPTRAGSGAHALAELDSAVQQSAAARGLLRAALAVPNRSQTLINPVTGLPATTKTFSDADRKQLDALTAAAQQARLRADADLADFRDTAPESAVDSYDSTVTGPEVNSAEKYLATLTDQPVFSDDDLAVSGGKLNAALSARVDQMRGVESALFDRRTKELAKLRDDDVTAWEIRIAVLGGLMLITVGLATAMARTLTRPLSVLRRGSERLAGAEHPGAGEPVRFTGRNDEFAQVVRAVNALHAHAAGLHERIGTLETDRKHLVGQRQRMADAREELRAELADATAQLERLRTSIGGTFVSLALRTLGLVERQLAVIEGLEEREQDPDRLATLFKLDHFATVMRRHSENLLVLAGAEHVQQHHGPVPLLDVVRAAVSEVERYERVRIAALPPHAHVAGFAADDLSHLLAELMENATTFSPPDLPVEVSGWLLESGEVMLSVQDEGIGMTAERLAHLNARLTGFDPDSPYEQEGEEGLGLGLYVVARLAHRHGARVQLREQKQGGIAAVVVLPAALLAQAPATAGPPAATGPGDTQSFSLPGADAEANSNVLRGRTKSPDPLVELAERAVEESAAGPDRSAAEPVAPTEAVPERAVPAQAVREPAAPDQAAPRQEPPRAPTPDEATAVPAESVALPGEVAAVSGEGLVLPDGVTGVPAEDPVLPGEAAAISGEAPGLADEVADVPDEAPAPSGDASGAPRETPAETTMELLLPEAVPAGPHGDGAPEPAPATPYAIGPDRHEHAADEAGEQLTSKGLPKRTPKIAEPATAPRQRTGSVDAEALRRRLGGFRRGAEAGRMDVEAEIAEIAEETGHGPRPDTAPAHAGEATGGTVEEASS